MDSTYNQEIRQANRLNTTLSYIAEIVNRSPKSVTQTAANLSSKLIGMFTFDLANFNAVQLDTVAKENALNRNAYLLEANNIYHRSIELIKLIDSSSRHIQSLTSRVALNCLTNFLQTVKCEPFQPTKEAEEVRLVTKLCPRV